MIGNLLAAGCADAIPQIHYLRFLNCMYHKEFAGAVASLHRFFDRSGLLGGSSPQNQYALLSLSVLHYTFNNTLLAKQVGAVARSFRTAKPNVGTGPERMHQNRAAVQRFELFASRTVNGVRH